MLEINEVKRMALKATAENKLFGRFAGWFSPNTDDTTPRPVEEGRFRNSEQVRVGVRSHGAEKFSSFNIVET